MHVCTCSCTWGRRAWYTCICMLAHTHTHMHAEMYIWMHKCARDLRNMQAGTWALAAPHSSDPSLVTHTQAPPSSPQATLGPVSVAAEHIPASRHCSQPQGIAGPTELTPCRSTRAHVPCSMPDGVLGPHAHLLSLQGDAPGEAGWGLLPMDLTSRAM